MLSGHRARRDHGSSPAAPHSYSGGRVTGRAAACWEGASARFVAVSFGPPTRPRLRRERSYDRERRRAQVPFPASAVAQAAPATRNLLQLQLCLLELANENQNVAAIDTQSGRVVFGHLPTHPHTMVRSSARPVGQQTSPFCSNQNQLFSGTRFRCQNVTSTELDIVARSFRLSWPPNRYGGVLRAQSWAGHASAPGPNQAGAQQGGKNYHVCYERRRRVQSAVENPWHLTGLCSAGAGWSSTFFLADPFGRGRGWTGFWCGRGRCAAGRRTVCNGGSRMARPNKHLVQEHEYEHPFYARWAKWTLLNWLTRWPRDSHRLSCYIRLVECQHSEYRVGLHTTPLFGGRERRATDKTPYWRPIRQPKHADDAPSSTISVHQFL